MDKNIERVKVLAKDESFMKELFTKQTAADAQAFFEENGVVFSLEEVKQLGAIFEKAIAGEISAEQIERVANGELSEDELEEAAGGIISDVGIVVLVFAGSVIATGSIAGGIAAVVKYSTEIGNWFASW